MKTNHRRTNTGKFDNGFSYGYLTSRSLMRHGCGPDYTGRKGARQAIAGAKKKKSTRSRRHAANQILRSKGYDD